MIIDSHVHLGGSSVFGTRVDEENLINTMKTNMIDACIVQSLPGALPSEKEVHNEIFSLSKKYPKKIFGLASVNPHLQKKQVIHEIERCIKDLGFVGIKCHTFGHSVSPLSESGDLLFKLADELDVPIVVHTGSGIPFSCPSLNMIKAKQYPDLKIILAHSGTGILIGEAHLAASEYENIYLETSWNSAEDIEWLIDSLGTEKVMMGSDIYNSACYNQAIELEKYKIINISDEDRDNCLYMTAKKIFNLDI